MKCWLASFCLQRILLPLGLLAAAAIRPNVLSSVYLILLLFVPAVPVPTAKTLRDSTGFFQKAVIFFSSLNCLALITFQIVLLVFPPYGSLLNCSSCGTLTVWLRFGGFFRLDGLSAVDIIREIAPEIIVLLVGISVHILCVRLNPIKPVDEQLLPISQPPPKASEEAHKKRKLSLLTQFGKYVCLLSLCLAGILRPSALSGVYFVVFLGSMTWWAFNKPLGKAFAYICRGLLVVIALHILTLYFYQTERAQCFLPPKAPIARYLGITALVNNTCTGNSTCSLSSSCLDPSAFTLADEEWASWVNPFALVWLYFILWYEASLIISVPAESIKDESMTRKLSSRLSQRKVLRSQANRWRTATIKVNASSNLDSSRSTSTVLSEKTPLIRGRESVYRRAVTKRSIIQDSMGSITIAEVPEENPKLENVPEEDLFSNSDTTSLVNDLFDSIQEKIQMDYIGNSRLNSNSTLSEPDGENGPGFLEIVINAGVVIAQLLTKSSYIATNIIMMAWSITYHSWLTFVLLLWAMVMWLMPNQRRAMLRSSPFLVLYAELLLLAQYIYGMDLNDNELPQVINGVDTKQIGLEKVHILPVNPLSVKTLFTVMFWITLKQFNQELWEAKNQSALADISAPLQIGVSAAAGLGDDANARTNILITKIGMFVRSLMTKIWIWVVAITLFAFGITGDRITLFRIGYMGLALIFILTFQLSLNLWRRIMYGFWLTVIIYSMLILVLMYTYQFDNFNIYWENYLLIPQKLQPDIGLKKFQTTELFVRLLSPTVFVVIAVIQLYYFHKDFLALSDIKSRGTSSVRPRVSAGSSAGESSGGGMTITTIESEFAYGSKRSFQFIDRIKSIRSGVNFNKITYFFGQTVEICWRLLELHLLKLIMLSIMLLAVYDVCALHFIFVLFSVISTLLGTKMQLIAAHTTSVLVSCLLLIKMIYQIEYIDHNTWNVTCYGVVHHGNNTLEWIGLYKTDPDTSLAEMLKGYIGIIVVVTFHSVVEMRQKYKRHLKGRPLSKPSVVFPRITHRDVDRGLDYFLKYMVNYGFYRFGMECCLLALAALIGIRMDFYALLYSFWLCALIRPNRLLLNKLWGFFSIFIVATIPLQYFCVVGLPPSLCIEYPWSDSPYLKRLQEWMFLPSSDSPPPANKLICDFMLLLMVCRQGVVFRLEAKYESSQREYAGGSNKSIIGVADSPHFQNPKPDFISYTRSWLNVSQKLVLPFFIWLSLAVVFLAGTNRVNLFSLGYLLGAFLFLWLGSDLYLFPIPVILKRWNFLIVYNVAVIVLKVLFQIPGCIFMNEMKNNACWLVQLLGIACIKKFGGEVTPSDPSKCEVPAGETGLAWDVVCFVFLILQRRLFNSYYCLHIINESKAMAILASRGAELIEDLSKKQTEEQLESERKVLEKIKNKMDRIKASQQRVQGPQFPQFKEPSDHFSVAEAPLARHSTPSISSPTSPQGFHTPVEEEEPVSLGGGRLAPPTPTSALLSRSLDGYLEPQRVSIGSPPASLHRAPSFDDSFPVFSPPPYGAVVPAHLSRRNTHRGIGPPWLGSFATPRQSIVSNTSPRSHHTYASVRKAAIKWVTKTKARPKSSKQAIRSGDYYMFDEFDEDIELDKEIVQPDKTDDKKDQDQDIDHTRPDIFELLSTAMKTDISKAARYKKTDPSRRKSMPVLPRKRSSSSVPYPRPRLSEGTVWRSCTSLPESPEGPQPGTSQDAEPPKRPPDDDQWLMKDDDDNSDDDINLKEEQKPFKDQNYCQKLITIVKFLTAFVNSAMITATKVLNRYSRDYRYVMKTLTLEKRLLKEKENFGVGNRDPHTMMWQPLPESRKYSSSSTERDAESITDEVESVRERTVEGGHELGTIGVPLVRIQAPSTEAKLDQIENSPVNLENVLASELEMTLAGRPPIFGLVSAIWYALLSHSELACYFIIFLHQIREPTIISLPLPLMVFLWGTLTIPRPSTAFWITIIAYTEIIVAIKCIFQFEVLNDNEATPDNFPFAPRRIIGVEHSPGDFASYDLLLLMVVFFHRSMLKSLGLWHQREPAPEHEAVNYNVEIGKEINNEDRKSLELGDKEDPRAGGDVALTDDEKHSWTPSDQPSSSHKRSSSCFAALQNFYGHLLKPGPRVTTDVYAFMFFCDFFNFLVVIFGFAAFGSLVDGGVSKYFEENKVPIPFLVMLFFQFALIIIDRTFYLRKFILGKVVFQFLLVIGIHIWMFFVLPAMTGRQFKANLPPQIWYVVKCFYLLLSAYQIRCGYPTRILGNFLCKGYNAINLGLFKAFMMVPFVFELRALMDWVWTDTSMTLSDWLKMEDIFAHVFQLKCYRRMEKEYPQERGVKKKSTSKYLNGGGCLTGIIAIIWFPLVLFALGNTVGKPNLPYDFSVTLRIGVYEPIYKSSAQTNSIERFSENDFDSFYEIYRRSRPATTFLSSYDYEDVGVIHLNTHSSFLWAISPPDNTSLIKELNGNNSIQISLTWSVARISNNPEVPGSFTDNHVVFIPRGDESRKKLVNILSGSNENVTLPYSLPKFLKVTTKGSSAVGSLLYTQDSIPVTENFRNFTVSLARDSQLLWWNVKEDCTDKSYTDDLRKLPKADCNRITIYTFNDKAFPPSLNIISGKGIIGLYTTFVIVIHSVIRQFFTGISFKIMFDDMPCVDRLLQLCLDIYLVRESGELDLEEDLFAKLVFLYRSPETLIKWTRPPEEVDDDENAQADLSD